MKAASLQSGAGSHASFLEALRPRHVVAIYSGVAFVLAAGAVITSLISLSENRFNLAAEADLVEFRLADLTANQGFAIESIEVERLAAMELESVKPMRSALVETNAFHAEIRDRGRLTINAIRLQPGARVAVRAIPGGGVEITVGEGIAPPIVEVTARGPVSVAGHEDVAPSEWESYVLTPRGSSGFTLNLSPWGGLPVRFINPLPVRDLAFEVDRNRIASASTLRAGSLQFDLWGRPDAPRQLRDGEKIEFEGLQADIRRLVVLKERANIVFDDGLGQVRRFVPAPDAVLVEVAGTVNGVEAGFEGGVRRGLTPSLLDYLVSQPGFYKAGGILVTSLFALIGALTFGAGRRSDLRMETAGDAAASPGPGAAHAAQKQQSEMVDLDPKDADREPTAAKEAVP